MKPFAPPPIILATAGDDPCGINGQLEQFEGSRRAMRSMSHRPHECWRTRELIATTGPASTGSLKPTSERWGSRHTVRDVRSRRRSKSGAPLRSTRGASPERGKPGSRPWMGGDPTSVAMDGLPRRSGFPRQARCRQPDVVAVCLHRSGHDAPTTKRCGRDTSDRLRHGPSRVLRSWSPLKSLQGGQERSTRGGLGRRSGEKLRSS